MVRQKQIEIMMSDEVQVEVRATIVPNTDGLFAVHQEPGYAGVIKSTHVPSGFALPARFETKRQAIEVTQDLWDTLSTRSRNLLQSGDKAVVMSAFPIRVQKQWTKQWKHTLRDDPDTSDPSAD